MRSTALILLLLLLANVLLPAEVRTVPVDFFVMLDTSLSMEGSPIKAAREYVAERLVGALLEPGDWFCLISFWGESRILWEQEIRGPEEKISVVRALRAIEAVGQYTDIGMALDTMAAALERRGHPDRPKYILLVTDEKQEAPPGSPYPATDYRLQHSMLDYIHRIDLGDFRVITVGYPHQASIEESAKILYKILSQAPDRPTSLLPGAPAGTLQNSADTPTTGPGQAVGNFQTGQQGKNPDSSQATAKTAPTPASSSSIAFWILVPTGFLALCVGIMVPLLRQRKRRNAQTEDNHRDH